MARRDVRLLKRAVPITFGFKMARLLAIGRGSLRSGSDSIIRRCRAYIGSPPKAEVGRAIVSTRASLERAELLRGILTNLSFLRRPTIGLGARAAHQHRPLTVVKPVSLEERLDGLLVVDHCVCACPVRAPQAALESPGIEHAG